MPQRSEITLWNKRVNDLEIDKKTKEFLKRLYRFRDIICEKHTTNPKSVDLVLDYYELQDPILPETQEALTEVVTDIFEGTENAYLIQDVPNVMFELERVLMNTAPEVKWFLTAMYKKRQELLDTHNIDGSMLDESSLIKIGSAAKNFTTELDDDITKENWKTILLEYYSRGETSEGTNPQERKKAINLYIKDVETILGVIFQRRKDNILRQIFNPKDNPIKKTQVRRKFKYALKNVLKEFFDKSMADAETITESRFRYSTDAMEVLRNFSKHVVLNMGQGAGFCALTRAHTMSDHNFDTKILSKKKHFNAMRSKCPCVKPKDFQTALSIQQLPRFHLGNESSLYVIESF